jgi:hypothetical protein
MCKKKCGGKSKEIFNFKYIFLTVVLFKRNPSRQGMCHGYQIVTSNTVATASGKVNDNFHDNGTMFSIAVVNIMKCCFFLRFLVA